MEFLSPQEGDIHHAGILKTLPSKIEARGMKAGHFISIMDSCQRHDPVMNS
jgi:hypothetical protein